MNDAIVRPAAAGDLDQRGVIGPASYAEAYAYPRDRPDAYARQLSTFGKAAFADLLGPVRGRGLGRRLLEAAAAEAVGHGASHLWLDAMASAGWAKHT